VTKFIICKLRYSQLMEWLEHRKRPFWSLDGPSKVFKRIFRDSNLYIIKLNATKNYINVNEQNLLSNKLALGFSNLHLSKGF
jgi:hypothetical protein